MKKTYYKDSYAYVYLRMHMNKIQLDVNYYMYKTTYVYTVLYIHIISYSHVYYIHVNV